MLESCKPGLEQSCWVEIFRPQTNSLTSCGAPLVVLIGSVSIIWSGHNTSGRTLSEEAKPQQQKRNTRADWAEGRRKQQGLRTVGGRDSNTAAGALEGEGRGSNLVKRLNWHLKQKILTFRPRERARETYTRLARISKLVVHWVHCCAECACGAHWVWTRDQGPYGSSILPNLFVPLYNTVNQARDGVSHKFGICHTSRMAAEWPYNGSRMT